MKRQPSSREKAFFQAIREHQLEVVGQLLNAGMAVEAKDPDSRDSALVCSIKAADKNIVKLLIARGAEVNPRCKPDNHPLFTACSWVTEAGGVDIVKSLLNAGARPKLPGLHDLSLLETVARMHLFVYVDSLIKAGAPCPPESEAAIDKMFIEYLLEARKGPVTPRTSRLDNFDPQWETRLCRPELTFAIECNRIGVVRWLLEHGTKVFTDDVYDPFFMACKVGNTEIIQLLIDHGAQTSPRIWEGVFTTACHWGSVAVLDLAMKMGAPPNTSYWDDELLHWYPGIEIAMRRKHFAIVCRLLKCDLDHTLFSSDLRSFLLKEAEFHHQSHIIQLLHHQTISSFFSSRRQNNRQD